METTHEAQENEQTEIPGTEPTREASPTEKKERKKKDLSGDFRYYAVENPFNKGIHVKRFRETVGHPLGAIFCKLVKGTPEYAKYAEEDGSCLVTWFLQEERGVAYSKRLAGGTVKYVHADEVIVQRSVVSVDAPVIEKKESKPKAEKKEKKVGAKRAPKVKVSENQDAPPKEFQYYEAPDDEEVVSDSGDLPVDNEPAGKFSFRKEALSYARQLGMSGKQADESVKKIDGYWQVVQS